MDAVWDRYVDASLKFQTRSKRGEAAGQRTRVSAKIPIPKGAGWQRFLKDSHNKGDLFQYLSDELVASTADATYQLFTTKADLILGNRADDHIHEMSPCQQEEADTRMMLHLHHAADHGHAKAYLRTVDTDVVIIAISQFQEIGLSELWIGFGSGKTFREIPIHIISQQLGPDLCKALPFFHGFTGCDVTSAMHGVVKKSAWNAWISFLEATDTFNEISQDPSSLTFDSQHMQILERLTVLMYSKNCSATSVNEARRLMFTHGLKSLEAIPPPKIPISSPKSEPYSSHPSGDNPLQSSHCP